MDIDYLLTSTRSVRKSLDLDAPVDVDEIRDCLRIGCQAANGTNMQTWRWVVVRDETLRAKIARLYQDAYFTTTGRTETKKDGYKDTPFGRIMSSTEWLVDHLAEVPLHVIPCYEPYLPDARRRLVRRRDDLRLDLPGGVELPARAAHPRVRHVHHDAAPAPRAGGRRPARHPGRLRAGLPSPGGPARPGQTFRAAPRRPIEEVVAVDGFAGPSL